MAHGELLAWFENHNGWLHPDVAIAQDLNSGLHFKARRSSSNIEVCCCPSSLSLSILNALDGDSLASMLFKHRDKNITIQTISYFLLAEQVLLNDNSFWHPYIMSLPKQDQLMLPIFYDEEDMKWLQGTNLQRAVEERQRQWHEDWEKACKVLECQGVEEVKVTWALFQWAGAIFTSRSFISLSTHNARFREPFPVLWPVVDLGNHRPMEKVEWAIGEKSFTLRTLGQVEEGEQIYNNYAPKGNEELLMGYGFALLDNPFNQYAVKLIQHPSVLYVRDKNFGGGRYTNQPEFLQGVPPLITNYFLNPDGAGDRASSFAARSTKNKERVSAVITIQKTFLQKLNILRTISDALVLSPDLTRQQRQRNAQIYRQSQEVILENVCLELGNYVNSYMWKFGTPISHCTGLMSFVSVSSVFHNDHFSKGVLYAYGMAIGEIEDQDIPLDTLWALYLCAARIASGMTFNTSSGAQEPANEDAAAVSNWIANLATQYPDLSEHTSHERTEEDRYFLEDFGESVRLARESLKKSALWWDPRWNGQMPLWAKRVVERELFTIPYEDGKLRTYMWIDAD